MAESAATLFNLAKAKAEGGNTATLARALAGGLQQGIQLEQQQRILEQQRQSKMADLMQIKTFEQGLQNKAKDAERNFTLDVELAKSGLLTDAQKAGTVTEGEGTAAGRHDFNKVGTPINRGTKLQRLSDVKRSEILSEKAIEEKKANAEISQRQFDNADKLFDDAMKIPSIQDYQKIRREASTIEAAYQASINPETKDLLAADQALVTSFNKMLDPNSVVRESEYARTPDGQAVLRRFEGRFQQLTAGGTGLTPEARAEIRNMALTLEQNAKGFAAQDGQIILNRAEASGTPLELLGGIEEIFKVSDEVPSQEIATEQTGISNGTGKLSNGITFTVE